METITKILRKHNFSYQQLEELVKDGINNGCGGKGGFNFSNFLDKMKKTPGFNRQKFRKFTKDLKAVCGIHDYKFYIGGNIIDFLTANIQLANDIQKLTHWTGYIRRIFTFLSIFLGTTILGWKYFNFN